MQVKSHLMKKVDTVKVIKTVTPVTLSSGLSKKILIHHSSDLDWKY